MIGRYRIGGGGTDDPWTPKHLYIHIYTYIAIDIRVTATSHPTNATRRNHSCTIKKQIITIVLNIFSKCFFPGRELWHWRPGWGWGGPFRTPKISKNRSYENCLHFRNIFPKTFKNIFKISSYIQKTTPNPINAFKITTYNTKHTFNSKIYFQKISKHRKHKQAENKSNISNYWFVIYVCIIFP